MLARALLSNRISFRGFKTASQLSSKLDYYSVLGVNRSDDYQSVKTAYFRLAKKYHPDFNKSASAEPMFELISEAYEVLSDPVKRKNYDDYGDVGQTFGGISQGPGRKRSDRSFSSEDIFRTFKTKGGVVTKKDLEEDTGDYEENMAGYGSTDSIVLNITFKDSIMGCISTAKINKKIICMKCHGSKSEWGFQGKSCPFCEGTGLETQKVGHMVSHNACSYCEGTGVYIKWKCQECAGLGRSVMGYTQEMKIPPGVENGEMLRFRYHDDLIEFSLNNEEYFYVKVMVDKSEKFTRDGLNICSKTFIDAKTALYGGEVEVEGVFQPDIKLTIPPGTSSHEKFTLYGHGCRHGHVPGDHIVEIGISVDSLDDATMEALKQIAAVHELVEEAEGECDDIVIPHVQEKIVKNNLAE